jgi:hypothetical protein
VNTRVRPRRPPRRSGLWRLAVWPLLVLVALVLGLSIGRALEDGPQPGGTTTSVRTLQPQPLPPAARTTVTVTTTTEP